MNTPFDFYLRLHPQHRLREVPSFLLAPIPAKGMRKKTWSVYPHEPVVPSHWKLRPEIFLPFYLSWSGRNHLIEVCSLSRCRGCPQNSCLAAASAPGAVPVHSQHPMIHILYVYVSQDTVLCTHEVLVSQFHHPYCSRATRRHPPF